MRALIFSLAMLLGAPAAAQELRSLGHAGAIDCGSVPLPPARFDHPSANRVTVMRLPFGLIDSACRARGILAPTGFIGANRTVALLDEVAGAGFEIQACSWTSGDDRYVLLPLVGTGGVTKDFDACALRHEIGHLNGWPSSHPDAHFGFLDEASAIVEAGAMAQAASFVRDAPLPRVQLLKFPRTAEGTALRRQMLRTRGVIVTVTEIAVGRVR